VIQCVIFFFAGAKFNLSCFMHSTVWVFYILIMFLVWGNSISCRSTAFITWQLSIRRCLHWRVSCTCHFLLCWLRTLLIPRSFTLALKPTWFTNPSHHKFFPPREWLHGLSTGLLFFWTSVFVSVSLPYSSFLFSVPCTQLSWLMWGFKHK